MLKKSYGKVTARGILFRGNRFTCPRAIREQWFEKAALDKSWKIKIVYKHELDSVIYLVSPEKIQGFSKKKRNSRPPSGNCY